MVHLLEPVAVEVPIVVVRSQFRPLQPVLLGQLKVVMKLEESRKVHDEGGHEAPQVHEPGLLVLRVVGGVGVLVVLDGEVVVPTDGDHQVDDGGFENLTEGGKINNLTITLYNKSYCLTILDR